MIKVNVRTGVQLFPGEERKTAFKELSLRPEQCAIITLGMWDHHKCKVATEYLDMIGEKGNLILKRLRACGVQIIHGSSTLSSNPKYKQMKDNIAAPIMPLRDYGMKAYPPLPIDDSDGGVVEVNPDFDRKKVTIHPKVELDWEKDGISGHPKEIMNFLLHKGIEYLFAFGTHTNMCVLDRPYGIKNLIRYGAKVVLIRDLCDVVHNPKLAPFTPRDETNEIMAKWVEEHFCPTAHSSDIVYVPEGKRIVYVDVDQTVLKGTYETVEPMPEQIAHFNKLYDEGNVVIYWTARGCVSGKDYLEMTRSQLLEHNVKFHSVRIGKPHYDKFYCDKAHNSLTDLQ